MAHTPGPYVVGRMKLYPGDDKRSRLYVARPGDSVSIASDICDPDNENDEPSQTALDNANLFAAAPTAPHECDVPNCPGAINKRKLDSWDDLLASLKEVKALLSGKEFSVCRADRQPIGIGDALMVGNIFERADAAIAKAEPKQET